MKTTKKNTVLLDIMQRQIPLPGAFDIVGAAYEIQIIEHYLRKPEEAQPAIRDLVPVRVVACIEGCLKASAAALINHGDPYLENARRLFQDININIDLLRAILDDQLSLGEIVAHSVGWHDMAAINSRMTGILGFEFFERLKTIEDRWAIELEGAPKKPIIDSLDKIIADIKDALIARHVLCHEVRSFQSVSDEDAKRFLEAGRLFTSATSWVMSDTLNPNEPLTQTDMNIEADKRAKKLDDELSVEVSQLLEKLDNDEDKSLLAKSQEAWRDYRVAHSEFEANAAKGGSMWPKLRAQAASAVTRSRMLEIQESLRQEGLGGPARRRRRPWRGDRDVC